MCNINSFIFIKVRQCLNWPEENWKFNVVKCNVADDSDVNISTILLSKKKRKSVREKSSFEKTVNKMK